jgi:hypothetical protein
MSRVDKGFFRGSYSSSLRYGPPSSAVRQAKPRRSRDDLYCPVKSQLVSLDSILEHRGSLSIKKLVLLRKRSTKNTKMRPVIAVSGELAAAFHKGVRRGARGAAEQPPEPEFRECVKVRDCDESKKRKALSRHTSARFPCDLAPLEACWPVARRQTAFGEWLFFQSCSAREVSSRCHSRSQK